MASILVRNLPDAVHRALKRRAADHGRSTEAEVREILSRAVRPEGRLRAGSALAEFGARMGGAEPDIVRDPAPQRPVDFG